MTTAVEPCACPVCTGPASVRNAAEREQHADRHAEFAAWLEWATPEARDPEPLPAQRQIEVIGQEFDPTAWTRR